MAGIGTPAPSRLGDGIRGGSSSCSSTSVPLSWSPSSSNEDWTDRAGEKNSSSSLESASAPFAISSARTSSLGLLCALRYCGLRWFRCDAFLGSAGLPPSSSRAGPGVTSSISLLAHVPSSDIPLSLRGEPRPFWLWRRFSRSRSVDEEVAAANGEGEDDKEAAASPCWYCACLAAARRRRAFRTSRPRSTAPGVDIRTVCCCCCCCCAWTAWPGGRPFPAPSTC
mmetsp:Transcript_35764/g.106744  ORF Transcript_35764/g.106744 Transcript_35764/m.106744 type:complete len:225 (+) Transcript_35764:1389-2063(+)